jgi:hypothetical protein
MEDLYQLQRYMTVELLSEILDEFEWPAPYTLEDDLPDGIVMTFPNSHLYFCEGFEGEMLMEFLVEDTNTDYNLQLGHALFVIIPESERDGTPLTPNLIDYWTPIASLEKVENGIRDLCKTVLYHLKPCILGDFSWVSKYLESHKSMAT